MGVEAGGGVGVSASQGYGALVIDLRDKALGKKGVGISWGRREEVGEGYCYAIGEDVGRRIFTNGKERSGGQGES